MSATLCVTPLSSPYCLLPRAHTYALVLALLAPLPRGWLFRAALAAFTMRTAIAAVDIVVLFAVLKKGSHEPAPLDIIVATETCALASLMAVWLLMVSQRGGESAARGLVRVWAAAVGIGGIIGFSALKLLAKFPTDKAVCEGILMEVTDVFGSESDVGSGLGVMGAKIGQFTQRVGITGIVMAAAALFAATTPRPDWQKKAAAKFGHDLEQNVVSSDITDSRNASSAPGSRIRTVFKYLSAVSVPALVVFIAYTTEIYVLKEDLPSAEKISSVGQWGVWAATGVVVIATAINASKENIAWQKGSHVISDQTMAKQGDEVVKF